MKPIITLKTNRDYYEAKECAENSMTVGEFMDMLSTYPNDAKIVFSNDNGYTYGTVGKFGCVFEDVCSGMNAVRPKFNQIFDLAEQHKITKLVVEHSDRLARFFIPVFERYFKSHGVEVEYVEQVMSEGFEQELCKDLITLMSSFSAKIYGRRSAENRKKNKK
jgi:predicted site-specific integrase-resolvase